MNFLLLYVYINLNHIDNIATVTGSSSNNILTFKLVRLGVYMVKLCPEKMRILRSILPPPQK